MRPTLHNLQALRGVACLMVFFLHLAVWEKSFGIARPLLGSFVWYGYAGVDLFFVLSGFLITHTQFHHLGRPAAVPGYLFRRWWRLYPTFWVVMLLGVGFQLLSHGQLPYYPAPDGPGPRTRWLLWLTLLPCRVPNLYTPPAWSLSYEVMFYLAFAGLFLLPRRLAPWALAAWGVGVSIAAWAIGPVNAAKDVWLAHAVSPFVWEFLLGCGVAWAVRAGFNGYGRLAVFAGVGWGAAWVLTSADPKSPTDVAANLFWRVGAFGPASALVVYGMVATEVQTGRRLPRWLERLGDASYSVYLFHSPVCAAVYTMTLAWWKHTFFPHLLWLAIQILVGVGGGVLLHRLVEGPLLNLFKKRRIERPTAEKVIDARLPAAYADRRSDISAGTAGRVTTNRAG